jgi:MYXO-CTERM domain-containing protein
MPASEASMLLFSLATATSATAAEPSLHDTLLHRFDVEFSRAHADEGHDGACLSELVKDLKENWSVFSPEERARISARLAPWKGDLVDATFAGTPPAPPDATPTDTCFGQQYSNRLTSEHFSVEWESGVMSSQAQGFLDALETSYDTEIGEYGWNAPDGDGRYLMATFIQQGNSASAYTTVQSCGGMYIPYIVAYSGSFSGSIGTWSDSMASHEFNHSLQFTYSYAPEFWWWEATATYVQHLVMPDPWWDQYITGYSSQPWIALGASDQQDQDIFWHMYGMELFGFYLDNYQGGTDIVRQTWQASSRQRGQYDWSAEDFTEAIGLDWQELYIDFITRNTVMDYDLHRLMGSITLTDTVRSLPASGEGSGTTRPQGYGQNYILLQGGFDSGDLHVSFEGDPDVPWVVVLAEVTSNSVERSEYSIIEDNGEGEVTLPNVGDRDVYLVVSPLDADDTKHSYSWTAEIVQPDDTDPDTTGDSGTDPGGDDSGTAADSGDGSDHVPRKNVDIDDTGVRGGCGCATPGSTGSGAALGLVALGLVTRRRRR